MIPFGDNLKAVAFDFDGVVADTMPMLSRLGRGVIQMYYDAPRHAASDLYWKTVGLPFIDQLEECFGANDSRNATAAEYFESRKKGLMAEAQPFPDIQRLLLGLAAKGIRTALCSSTRSSLIEDFCKKNKLPFIWLGGIEHGKKHTQLLKFIRICGLSSEQILFLGDSIDRDASFADKAGVPFAHVDRERRIIVELLEKYAS